MLVSVQKLQSFMQELLRCQAAEDAYLRAYHRSSHQRIRASLLCPTAIRLVEQRRSPERGQTRFRVKSAKYAKLDVTISQVRKCMRGTA